MEIDKKKFKKALLIPIILLFTLLYSIVNNGSDKVDVKESDTLTASAISMTTKGAVSDEVHADIYVDVCGAVQNPKVVCIPYSSRVFEAIEAAGGKTSSANTVYINMAAQCADGQKIYIPTADEINSGQYDEEISKIVTPATTPQSSDSTTSSTSSNSANTNNKININTAGSDELQELTGIGPAMAARIIEYRESNGNFSAVEDITNVSGIGEKTLAKFIDAICV